MTKYEIKKSKQNQIVIIEISGEIDSSNYDDFRHELKKTVSSITNNLIIDLTDVISISSNGWGIFYVIQNILNKNKLKLIISGMSNFLYEISEMIKFSDFFIVTRDINEAIKKFQT